MGKLIQLKDENNEKLYPIADIYDSGSNANGHWIRYNNGVMKCWNKVYYPALNCNNAFGTGFMTNVTTVPNYPIPFTTIDSVTTNIDNNMMIMIDGNHTTTKPANFRGVRFTAYQTNVYFYYIAIGKWK